MVAWSAAADAKLVAAAWPRFPKLLSFAKGAHAELFSMALTHIKHDTLGAFSPHAAFYERAFDQGFHLQKQVDFPS